MMEKSLRSTNKEITWIMEENLKKNRLIKMDKAWVEAWSMKLKERKGGQNANC